MKKKILKNDLMFHAVHGLCRAVEVPVSGTSANYSFIPVARGFSKARFNVAHEFLESAGFHKLISSVQAANIMNFFKNGARKKTDSGSAWEMAVLLREESLVKEVYRDKRRAQAVNQSAIRLTNELALVLKVTAREAAEKIRENLECSAKVSPVVLNALACTSPF